MLILGKLMQKGKSLMQNESNAESSYGSFLHYFHPVFRIHLSEKQENVLMHTMDEIKHSGDMIFQKQRMQMKMRKLQPRFD